MGDWRITWRSIIVPLLAGQQRDDDELVWTIPYWNAPPGLRLGIAMTK